MISHSGENSGTNSKFENKIYGFAMVAMLLVFCLFVVNSGKFSTEFTKRARYFFFSWATRGPTKFVGGFNQVIRKQRLYHSKQKERTPSPSVSAHSLPTCYHSLNNNNRYNN